MAGVAAFGWQTPAASGGGGGTAPADATYITQTPNATLTTGLMKVTTTTGVVSTAAVTTDYPSPAATYITQTAAAAPTNSQALGALATGLLKSTTTTGVVSIAAAGTDYATPASVPNKDAKYIVQQTDGTLANAQSLGALASGILKSTTTTGVVSVAVAGTDYLAPLELSDVWRVKAASRLGVSASSLLWTFLPVGQTGERSASEIVVTGTGVRSYQSGGKYRLDTATQAGSTKYQPGGFSGNFPIPAVTGAATKIWIGARAAFLDGAGTNSFTLIGLYGGTGTVVWGIGGRGAQSTTNFVVYGSSGTPFDTGSAFDTSLHDWELYRADGATTVPVKDGVQLTTGNARAGADAGLGAQAIDSSVGAQRRIDIVWLAIATVAP